MTKINEIIILFNPNSTGDSERNARDLGKSLKKRINNAKLEIIATEYKGHAAEIASERANNPSLLIVSSSGDGGYNEVINGVLASGGRAITTVLPSGNANDHHSTLGSDDVVERIVAAKVEEIDVLKLEATMDKKSWVRYAHSYIGFGLTPKVGHELTERRPNVVTEKWYALRHILSFKYVSIKKRNKTYRYSNLLFATIPRMSKVIKLNQDASVKDGLMEIYETSHMSVLSTLRYLFIASTKGLSHKRQSKECTFMTKRRTLVQLDGEVFKIDGMSSVTISCEWKKLRTIL